MIKLNKYRILVKAIDGKSFLVSEVKIFFLIWEKFFWNSILDIFKEKKCPKKNSADILPTFVFHPYHILKLSSGHKNNNFQFDTINFLLYFIIKYLEIFSVSILY